MAIASDFILAIDQGTVATTAVLIDPATSEIVARGRRGVSLEYPQRGWVQQDADELWQATVAAIDDCLALAPGVVPGAIALTTQREAAVAWSRTTGIPWGPVLAWQDARTAGMCAQLSAAAVETVRRDTGLSIDPLYSAPKMRWLLDHAIAAGAPPEDVCVGTIDSWLLWNLTEQFVIEAGNAARTLMFDIHRLEWSEELMGVFGIHASQLPRVERSDGNFGCTVELGRMPAGVPVAAVLADSHASLYFHGCTEPGTGKATYKAGCSVMMPMASPGRVPDGVTETLAWLTDTPTYAREGNTMSSGILLQWAAEFLGRVPLDPGDRYLTDLARSVPDTGGVVVVPAFTGLGAPYWDREATSVIVGMTPATSPAHVARAALEAVAHQVTDVVEAMEGDGISTMRRLQADGEWARSSLLMDLQADLLGRPVIATDAGDAAVMGVAIFAARALGMSVGDGPSPGGDEQRPSLPTMANDVRMRKREQWADAIKRSRGISMR